MRTVYTQEMKDFIQDNYKTMDSEELASALNEWFGTHLTYSCIKSYKSNNGLSGGKKRAYHGLMLFSQEEFRFIMENYRGITSKELADLVNAEFGTSYTEKQLLSFKKNHHSPSGVDTRFKKGQASPNKGKTWDELGYSNEAKRNSLKTCFKKGHLPKNHRPVGSEKLRCDGMVYIKVSEPNGWRKKQHVIWEEANGKIPKGMAVTFLNGDTKDVRIENLSLISAAEHLELTRNHLRFNDTELTKTGIAIAKVNIKTREAMKRCRTH